MSSSEHRRPALITLAAATTVAAPDAAAAAAGGGDVAHDDAAKKPAAAQRRSVRLTFVLPAESSEDICPIFNYKEEFAVAKKKEKKLQNGKVPTNGLDPFDEDDDDVKRIAMEMEAKYGSTHQPPAKKKRKGRRDDYADIGMGYDESDSFIDNTDGYDEMIPLNVTTLHGGFYINCGALEFKTDEAATSDFSSSSSSSSSSGDEDEEDADDKVKPTQGSGRKRVLSTDSEGEQETEKDKAGEQQQQQQARPAVAEKKHKSNATNGSNGVANGLPAKKKHKELGPPVLEPAIRLPTPPVKKQPPPPSQQQLQQQQEEVKKKTVKELLKEKRIEPPLVVVPVEVPSKSSDTVKQPSIEVAKRGLSEVIELVASGDAVERTKVVRPPSDAPSAKEVYSLPENLPAHIAELIRSIKDSARRNLENNTNVLNGSVNSLLISFERKGRVLGKQSRSRIYQHLAARMRMPKEALCKQAKQLVVDEDTRRLATLLSDLRDRVTVSMPAMYEQYELECARASVMQQQQQAAAPAGEKVAFRNPKRKYQWPEEARRTFREAIIVKKRLLIYEGKTKESIEIHLNLFMKTEVQSLWPDGWMTMAVLCKLSNSFEKKPAASSPLVKDIPLPPQPPLPPVPKANHAPTGEKKEKEAKKPIYASNAISITPISLPEPTPPPSRSHSKGNESINSTDLASTANKIAKPSLSSSLSTSSTASGLSICPIPAVKSTIQQRSVYKPEKERTSTPPVDRQTKFVNLAQLDVSPAPENLSRPRVSAPSTDYNIDSIMSRKSSSEQQQQQQEQQQAGRQSASPTVTIKEDPARIPIENFMPKPLAVEAEVKEEPPADDDDIIVLDDDDQPNDSKVGILSSVTELRRKPGPKSKTKYCDPTQIKSVKASPSSSNSSDIRKTVNSEKPAKEPKIDGDDFLQLMENLKELNKMSTPTKIIADAASSGGGGGSGSRDVSVISFNKYNKTHGTSGSSTTTPASSKQKTASSQPAYGADNMTYHDVYQRQILNELKSSLAAPSPTTTTGGGGGNPQNAAATKNNYNSGYPSASSTSSTSAEKHYNSNNNYTMAATTTQGAKYKSNYQRTGAYNIMDDMLANFITEYAYPKQGNKPKSSQK